MKKTIAITIFLVNFYQTYSQTSTYQQYNIANGDFSNYTQLTPPGNMCPTWSLGELQNWEITHGTPTYNNGTVFMVSRSGPGSEGIFGTYPFIQGEKYYIDIGVIDFVPPCSTDVLNVSFENNLSAVVNAKQSINCQGSPPKAQQPFETLTNPMTNSVWKLQEFVPNSQLSQIWITPNSPASCTGPSTVVLDYVNIYKCLNGRSGFMHDQPNWYDLPLQCYRTLSPQIPSGFHHREIIYVWSGNLLHMLRNNQNENTKLLGRAIYLGLGGNTTNITNANFSQHNVEITVNEGSWFIIEAVWGCRDVENSYPPDPEDPHEDGHSKPGKKEISSSKHIFSPNYFAGFFDNTNTNEQQNTTEQVSVRSSQFSIYPNPTTGSFNIQMLQRGHYTIRVMNLLGTTVYEGQMTDEQKKSILLDNNLPPGNYTLHISGDGLRHVERITLTK